MVVHRMRLGVDRRIRGLRGVREEGHGPVVVGRRALVRKVVVHEEEELGHMVVAVMGRDIRREVVEMEHRSNLVVGEEEGDRIGLEVDSDLAEEEEDLQEEHRKAVVVEGKVVVDDNLGVEDVPEEDMRHMAAD